MGYTHYWDSSQSDSPSWKAIWPRLVEDTRLIIEASDVLMCGRKSWDADNKVIPAPVVDLNEGIYINGVADDGHEPLVLGKDGDIGFCKTLQKPYNDVVACVLLRASELAPDVFTPSSDGDWEDQWWVRARTMYDSLWPGKSPDCPWYRKEETGLEEATTQLQGCCDDQDNKEDKEILSATETPTERSHIGEKNLASNEEGSLIAGLDFSLVNSWLSSCEQDSNHSRCRPSPLRWEDLQGVHFRLIDVQKRCVINAPGKCSFVALSYVWGGIDQPLLTKTSMPTLMQEGGLDILWSLIPATVRDAMIACKRLGQQYLWVDALCIQQDSSRDLRIQIVRMRQIYSAATFTIAAVSAESADQGLLPSYFMGDSTAQAVEEGRKSLDDTIETSPWSKRAWCYQEKVLSHRMLFFTSTGVYLQCQDAIFGLDQHITSSSSNNGLSRFNLVGGMLSVAEEDELNSYCSAVEHFSSRLLTKRSDKMNAFQGIFRKYRGRMNSKPSSFVFGHPMYAFDQTFCWRSADGLHHPQSRNKDFPSWSWLGWDNAVSFDYDLLSIGHTSQIIYQNHVPFGGFDTLETTREFHIRKPADHYLPGSRFGFPGSVGGQFYNNKTFSIYVCMAELCISESPVQRKGSNGLYEVFPVFCGQWQRPARRAYENGTSIPHSSTITIDEFNAAHAVPNPQQSRFASKYYKLTSHATHKPRCQARTPLGKVWLDEAWRGDHPKDLVMGCFPIAGYRGRKHTCTQKSPTHSDGPSSSISKPEHTDEAYAQTDTEGEWEDLSSSSQSDNDDRNDKKEWYKSRKCPADKGWTITSVMLTQRMQKMGWETDRERLQVMKCEISQSLWEEIGSYILVVGVA